MRTLDIYISAVGSYLPPIVSSPVANENTMTGAAVGGDMPAVDMALRATRQALDRWGQGVDPLALLLYVDVYHTGPDGWQPQAYLQRHAVGGNVLAAGIRQGCNGVFGALELSAGYLRAQPASSAALIVAADNLGSPLVDRWAALDGYCMGDGATALILSREPGFARLLSVTSVTMTELEEMHRAGEPLHPPGVVAGRPLNFQERSDAFMGPGGLAPDLAAAWVENLREVVLRALKEADIDVTQVKRAAFHNGPRESVDISLMAIGLPPSVSTWEYGRSVGHSASDQVLSFEHLLKEGELVAGDHLLMVGVGPGLTFAVAVIEIIDRPAWAHNLA